MQSASDESDEEELQHYGAPRRGKARLAVLLLTSLCAAGVFALADARARATGTPAQASAGGFVIPEEMTAGGTSLEALSSSALPAGSLSSHAHEERSRPEPAAGSAKLEQQHSHQSLHLKPPHAPRRPPSPPPSPVPRPSRVPPSHSPAPLRSPSPLPSSGLSPALFAPFLRSPPPPLVIDNKLSHAVCHAWLRDPTHRFRTMWASGGWEIRFPNMHACFGDRTSTYFDDLAAGVGCESNWFSGGLPGGARPEFSQPAPAVLGFDDAIAGFCFAGVPPRNWERMVVSRCVESNNNILAIFDPQNPYSLCKNLQWQVCAAMGKLPGQGSSKILKFASSPADLLLSSPTHAFGQCRGFNPKGCKLGYGSDDIYYLEVCLYSQICTNGADLFQLEAGEAFKCKFSAAKLKELKELLNEPMSPTNTAYTSEALATCKGWCRRESCHRNECVGCGEERGCSPPTS